VPDLPDLTPSPEIAAELAGLRAELAVARAEAARWRTSFDLSAAGMALASLDGRFLDVNQRLCEMLGYTRQQLQALRFQDVTHPDAQRARAA